MDCKRGYVRNETPRWMEPLKEVRKLFMVSCMECSRGMFSLVGPSIGDFLASPFLGVRARSVSLSLGVVAVLERYFDLSPGERGIFSVRLPTFSARRFLGKHESGVSRAAFAVHCVALGVRILVSDGWCACFLALACFPLSRASSRRLYANALSLVAFRHLPLLSVCGAQWLRN